MDNHIRDLILNSGKKVNQQLPRINAQRGEGDSVNSYHRQYMINQKRQNPEILRTYMKNKSVTRPSSREISGMFSHRDRMQQDSYADSYRTEKLTSIDESSKWEKSIRKEGSNMIEGLVKHQSVPLLKIHQSLGYDKKLTQRIRLQKQIASIEGSSPAPSNGKLRRSRTTGEPSRERASAGEFSTENPHVSPERTPEAYSSPFLSEGMKPVNLEQKIFSAGLKNPMPYWMNSNLTEIQEEIQENLKKAGFRRSLAGVNHPGVRVINETPFPLDILERNKIPLNQNFNSLSNQVLISGREDKSKQQPMSMEIVSAGLPSAGGLVSKYNSNEQPRKLQRALSDVKNKHVSHLEDSSPSPDPHEGRSFSAAKLRPKFRSQEAILNRLFNRKKS